VRRRRPGEHDHDVQVGRRCPARGQNPGAEERRQRIGVSLGHECACVRDRIHDLHHARRDLLRATRLSARQRPLAGSWCGSIPG